MTSSLRHQLPYDAHSVEMINRAKFVRLAFSEELMQKHSQNCVVYIKQAGVARQGPHQ